jgi:cyclopropane fatty-acyl-phospholipid synthase-like methyltransferase
MWNERYSETGFAYGSEANDFLRENVGKLLHGKVLCLADGEGRNGVFLAEKGFEVTAVDLSEVGLAKAQDLATERGVSITTIQADLGEFEIAKNFWDAIISIWAHVPSVVRRELHLKVVKGLKNGGAFLLEAYTPRQIEFGTGGPRAEQVDLTMQLTDLREELNGLQFEIAHEIEREIHEGKYHDGHSAVVQILAYKK